MCGARNPSAHYVTGLFYWIPLAFDRLAVYRQAHIRPVGHGFDDGGMSKLMIYHGEHGRNKE